MKDKKRRWYNSIRIKIPAIIVVIIIIPVIIFWRFTYNNLLNNVKGNTVVIVESGLSNLALNIEYMLSKITSYASEQVNDTEFIQLVEDYLDAPEATREVSRSLLTLYLSQNVLDNTYIDSAFVVIQDGENIVTTIYGSKEISVYSPTGRKIYDLYNQSKVNTIAWFTAPNYLMADEPTLSYIRPIKTNNTKYPNISLICNIDSNDLFEMINNIALTESYIAISDYKGEVMLLSDTEFLNTNISNDPNFESISKKPGSKADIAKIKGRDYLIVSKTSLQTSWNYLEAVPMDILYGNLQDQMLMIYVIAAISILVSVLGALIVTRYVVGPINRLVGGLKNVEKGELFSLDNTDRNDEVGFMLKGYNNMVLKLKSLIDELYIKEILRKEAQMRTIQSQINEHFLYNVLNSIYCIAKKEKAENSAEMIDILSKFFRLSLSKGHEYVTVRDVVELINYYIWIQKVRYDERLVCDVQADNDILDKYVLKYLFQPIVENAVLHGIESKHGEGLIHILFKNEDGLLFFKVSDNGVGMSAEKLDELNLIFCQPNKIKGDNFALKNINAQIKTVYGEEYGLSVSSVSAEGTEVSFRIPLKESGDKTDE